MVKEILNIRRYKAGYEIREEVHSGSEYGCEDFTVKVAYTPMGDYIGNSKNAYYLCKKRSIKPEKASPKDNVCSVGWCKKEQKWYGWSHRAISGFGIGSRVKKGDCGYVPETPQKLFNDITKTEEDGYQWQKPEDVEITHTGVKIKYSTSKVVGENPDGSLIIVPDGFDYQIIDCGRGEWEALTLEDGKQMAIDFAEGVS